MMEERLNDVIENCQIIINHLSAFAQTDRTPQGRMIAQCKWLTEKSRQGDLILPVDDPYISTLRHIHAEGYLQELFKNDHIILHKIDLATYRLLKLTKKNLFILKPPYYSYAIRCMDALIYLLRHPTRELNTFEAESISELQKLREKLADNKIEPPLISYLPGYPCFRKVYRLNESTIDDIPNGKELAKLIADLFFEGVRPDSWSTPDAADRATRQWAS